MPPFNAKPDWLHWLETCPSTNTWAINAGRSSAGTAASRCPDETSSTRLQHGNVVFTRQQTAGRGQHGRIWHSPPGVLTASILLDQIPAVHLPSLSLAAGLATIDAIEELIPTLRHKLRLKWSNDVLFDGRKLAGILCEAISARQGMGRVVVGVGLNRCVEFDQAKLDTPAVPAELREVTIPRAISLHQLSSSVPDELLLLERLRHYLLQTAEQLRCDRGADEGTPLIALLPKLRQRDALIGRGITVDLGTKQVSGEAAGLSDRGHLLLKCADGTLRSFVSGHILL